MEISGKTKIMALFGHPVEHTLSPAMHNSAFDALGLDFRYVAFEVKPSDLSDAVRGIRSFGLAGVNITVPHKENIISYLDSIDPEAQFIGAVNTLVNSGGRLKGYNTDGRGFMKSLTERGIDVSGKKVFVAGAGGASRAIGYYLCEKASSLHIYDVDADKAGRLCDDLAARGFAKVSNPQSMNHVIDADIVINATPLGLKQEDPMPIETGSLKKDAVAGDLIYRDTRFLAEARARGLNTFNGLGMLLWQGVLAFELWTGKTPPVDVMRKALLDKIAAG